MRFLAEEQHNNNSFHLWWLVVIIVCFQVASTNSRTSTLWKLNTKTGRITSYPKDTEVSISFDLKPKTFLFIYY